jgi:FKBP-type peptidyl-prolyl cis-trans isomerase 2
MSVTTVPIQPIKKGSIPKFWFGIAALALAGGGLAWLGTGDVRDKYQGEEQFLAGNAEEAGVTVTKSGLQIKTIRGGEGKPPSDADIVLVNYKGTLRDGTVFDQNPQAPMEVNGVVPGFSEALKLMQRGGKYKIWIPGKLAYGENPPPNSPLKANSTLIFDVELLDYRSRAEVEAMRKEAEAMQQQQRGGSQQGASQGVPQGLPPEIQQQLEAQMRQQQQGQ